MNKTPEFETYWQRVKVEPPYTPKEIAAHAWNAAAESLQADAQRWQPMDTAPKDGKEVILQVELRAGIPGKCLVGHYMQGGHCIEDHPPIDQGWYFWNGCMFDRASKPIAWMPLPALSVGQK